MTSDTSTPHWVVVVHQDERDVYSRLRRAYDGLALVQVLLDRRDGQRRRAAEGPAGERRQADRRRSTLPRAVSASHRLVQRTETHDVFEAASHAVASCPRCRARVEFELPRFGELPARLNLSVFHLPSESHRVKHFVEADAFRATGRSILACRLLARLAESVETPDSAIRVSS